MGFKFNGVSGTMGGKSDPTIGANVGGTLKKGKK